MGRGVRSPADWGSVVSSPSEVWAGAPALSHFLHILGHRTLLVARKILRASNSRGGRAPVPGDATDCLLYVQQITRYFDSVFNCRI